MFTNCYKIAVSPRQRFKEVASYYWMVCICAWIFQCLVPMPGVEIRRVLLDEIPRCQCDPNVDSPCGPSSECLNRALMYECHPLVCLAGDRCCNQNFLCRKDPPMEPFFTGTRGWGVKTKVDIVKARMFSWILIDPCCTNCSNFFKSIRRLLGKLL